MLPRLEYTTYLLPRLEYTTLAGTRPGPIHRLTSRCGIRRKAHPALAICGAYNIISRNLGLESGGAIGLSLFLSQAFSVTLYAFGLAESVRFIWPSAPVGPTAFVIVLGIGVLASRGSAIALKVQLPLLLLVVVSLAALIGGTAANPLPDLPPLAQSTAEVDYWVAFAVFLPAVTGVMAGLGFSGDLHDPKASIPLGPFRQSCWVSPST